MPAEASSNKGYGLVLVPQSPIVRTIFFKEGGSCRLSFPYSLFALFYFRTSSLPYSLKRLHVIFGQKPFTGTDLTEEFFGLPIRNHDGAFATCFYEWSGEQTAVKFAQKIIGQYWMSPFAEYEDWASWWTKRYNSSDPTFLNRWKEATAKKDYDFIMKEPLLKPDHHVNLGKLLAANKSHYDEGGIEIVSIIPQLDSIKELEASLACQNIQNTESLLTIPETNKEIVKRTRREKRRVKRAEARILLEVKKVNS